MKYSLPGEVQRKTASGGLDRGRSCLCRLVRCKLKAAGAGTCSAPRVQTENDAPGCLHGVCASAQRSIRRDRACIIAIEYPAADVASGWASVSRRRKYSAGCIRPTGRIAPSGEDVVARSEIRRRSRTAVQISNEVIIVVNFDEIKMRCIHNVECVLVVLTGRSARESHRAAAGVWLSAIQGVRNTERCVVRLHHAVIVDVQNAASRLESTVSGRGKFARDSHRQERKIGAQTGKHVGTGDIRKSGDIVEILLVDRSAAGGTTIKADHYSVLIRGERKLPSGGAGQSLVQLEKRAAI